MSLFISSSRFVPHSYDDILRRGVYNPPLPENFYNTMCSDYESLTDVEVARITYDSDGLAITGIMATPKQDGPRPLVIYNRGGNAEFGSLTVHSVMQHIVPFAKRGYLVLASNYRGNDGSQGKDEFGGSDINDVLHLLALGRKHPAFDGKNAYMIGRSRGGAMTFLAIKHGAKLNAAVSMAGVSDVFASIDERPEMKTAVYEKLIPPTSDWEGAIRARSARCWPEKLTTPLLLLHGDNDVKVDVHHSVRLAEDLEKLGLPHKLKIYPGDNHALLRNAADVVDESCQWMEAHRQ